MRFIPAMPLIIIGTLASACMSVPTGLHVYVSEDGCTSTGACPYGGQAVATYYYPPLREIVAAPNQGASTLLHEACHAHQHQVILTETGKEPTINLREWLATAEGTAFITATGWQPDGGTSQWGPTYYPTKTPWAWLSVQSPLEDAANTCSLFYRDPDELEQRSQARYNWAMRFLGL